MCAICLADYVDGEELKRLHCNHHFHSKCLDDWLPLSKKCASFSLCCFAHSCLA